MWKNCPHWLHIKPKTDCTIFYFFCLFSPSNQKNPPSTHSRFPTVSSYFRFPWSSTQFAISLHFSLVLPVSSVYLTSLYTCLVHQHGVFFPLNFHFTQTNSLDFFSLPAMHSRRVPWLQKTILLEVLQAQVLEDKKPPQLIVLSNCNGAAMAKNNTNQETSIGSSILLWDTRTHLILIETTAPASMPVWKWILFSVICYCECPGHLWSIPGTEDQTAAAVSSPQLLSKMKHHFKRNSVFSCWMTVSPTSFRKLAWGILTFEDICLVIGSLVSVWGQLILVTDRIKENLPS